MINEDRLNPEGVKKFIVKIDSLIKTEENRTNAQQRFIKWGLTGKTWKPKKLLEPITYAWRGVLH